MPIEITEFRDERLGQARQAAARSSACILAVNLDQEYHEGTNWDETVRVLNESCSFCVIVVVDELHGLTDALKSPLFVLQDEDLLQARIDEMKQAASERGKAWVEKIQARWRGEGVDPKIATHIPKFTIPFMITHWRDWTDNCSHYVLKKQYIDAMYNLHKPSDEISDADCLARYGSPKVSNLHTAVDIVVHTFVGGFLRRLEKEIPSAEMVEFDLQTASRLSREYTLIELTMVEMCRARCYPEKVAEKISEFDHVNLAYFFGQNSTNKTVFNCFKKFCSPKFEFLNLVKTTKQPMLSRSSPQKESAEPHALSQQNIVQLSSKMRDTQISQLHGAEDRSFAASSHFLGDSTSLGNPLKKTVSEERLSLSQPSAMFGGVKISSVVPTKTAALIN